jgi:hypothetical protein
MSGRESDQNDRKERWEHEKSNARAAVDTVVAFASFFERAVPGAASIVRM